MMLGGLGKRLGFIAIFAIIVLTVSAVSNILDPRPAFMRMDPPEATQLAAPLSNPTMARALYLMQTEYGANDGGSGAQLTFQSPSGPVVLRASEVAVLNTLYYSLGHEQARMDRRISKPDHSDPEQLANDGWGSGTGY
jgi:hypothetical protein